MVRFEQLTEREMLEHIIPAKAIWELRSHYSDLYTALLNTTKQELEQIEGISKKQAKEIILIVTLAKRLYKKIHPPIRKIQSAKDVYDYYEYLKAKEVEEFHILCLDVKNGIRMPICISKGTLNSSSVSIREIFCTAVRCRAASIILVHNHPSGIPEPSKEDIEITQKLVKAGAFLQIEVHDHVIIGKQNYYSMKKSGLLSET